MSLIVYYVIFIFIVCWLIRLDKLLYKTTFIQPSVGPRTYLHKYSFIKTDRTFCVLYFRRHYYRNILYYIRGKKNIVLRTIRGVIYLLKISHRTVRLDGTARRKRQLIGAFLWIILRGHVGNCVCANVKVYD